MSRLDFDRIYKHEPVLKTAMTKYEEGEKIEKKLKRAGAILFEEGYAWFYSHKRLDKAVSLDDNGNKKKYNPQFMRGFQAACCQFGFDCGRKGDSLDNVPADLLNDCFFLDGYKKGLQYAERERVGKSTRK